MKQREHNILVVTQNGCCGRNQAQGQRIRKRELRLQTWNDIDNIDMR